MFYDDDDNDDDSNISAHKNNYNYPPLSSIIPSISLLPLCNDNSSANNKINHEVSNEKINENANNNDENDHDDHKHCSSEDVEAG